MAPTLRWLALLGLAGLPGSLADAGPANVTCINGQSDQTNYTTSTGSVFQVLCGVDYGGGDLTATTTDTFAGCIEACASTNECIDVSYVAPSCYMKNQLETPLSRNWVWTAKQVATAPSGSVTADNTLTCDNNASDGQTYKAANSNFLITCQKDHPGGDLLGLSTATFEDCINACDANPECVNVAYVYGACYLKDEQTQAVNTSFVWGAVRQSASASGTGSTTASATSSSTPSSTALSCQNNASNNVQYTTAKGGKYQIMCGADYGGGDLVGTTAATFEDCIAACDDNTDCIDVSYVAPSCYLKKTIGTLSQVGYVWTAKQLAAPSSEPAPPVLCPQWDNHVYTDGNANQWLIRCNHDYRFYDITQIWTDTIEECMSWCSSMPACKVASWIPQSPDSIHRNCYAKTAAGEARDDIYDSMVLLN